MLKISFFLSIFIFFKYKIFSPGLAISRDNQNSEIDSQQKSSQGYRQERQSNNINSIFNCFTIYFLDWSLTIVRLSGPALSV